LSQGRENGGDEESRPRYISHWNSYTAESSRYTIDEHSSVDVGKPSGEDWQFSVCDCSVSLAFSDKSHQGDAPAIDDKLAELQDPSSLAIANDSDMETRSRFCQAKTVELAEQ
jgi:hypothetical protein